MHSLDLNDEVVRHQERLKSLDDAIKSLVLQSDEIDKYTKESFEKLIARVGSLESDNNLQKRYINELIDYKKTSDDRIIKLETTASNYKMAIIVAIAVLTGVGAIITFLLNSYAVILRTT